MRQDRWMGRNTHRLRSLFATTLCSSSLDLMAATSITEAGMLARRATFKLECPCDQLTRMTAFFSNCLCKVTFALWDDDCPCNMTTALQHDE